MNQNGIVYRILSISNTYKNFKKLILLDWWSGVGMYIRNVWISFYIGSLQLYFWWDIRHSSCSHASSSNPNGQRSWGRIKDAAPIGPGKTCHSQWMLYKGKPLFVDYNFILIYILFLLFLYVFTFVTFIWQYLIILIGAALNAKFITIGSLIDMNDNSLEEILAHNKLNKLQELKISKGSGLTIKSLYSLLEDCPNLVSIKGIEFWEGVSKKV